MEEAQWFYEDFIRPLDPALPSLSLKAFALRIFQHCPLMSQWSHYHHITAFSEFLAYKTRVPVRGAIMLNEEMDEVVLVKGWKKGANWSFPRGKINKDEKDLDCAIREVYEETGFDMADAGLIKDEKDVKFIEITMREQHMRLYVFRGVPRNAYFEPRTRKEISKIEWYKLSDLPTLKRSKQQDQGFVVASANKFYMVAPFMHPLKKWIAYQKKIDVKTQAGVKRSAQMEAETMDEASQLVNSGITPIQMPLEMAVPSDLPEVTSSQDASAHLKRLLNINNANMMQTQPQPPQASDADLKSNALLQMLRGGSSHESPTIGRNDPAMSSHVAPAATMPQPFPVPNMFPGFPPQDQYAGQSATLPQSIPPHLPGIMPPQLPPPANLPVPNQAAVPPRQLGHEFPLTAHMGQQNIPPFLVQQPPITPYREDHLAVPAPQKPGPAPYQRTGDPQFSHPGQPPQIQGAAVPPASKLPPPKLNSHSLALLNVFKDENQKTPKPANSNLAVGLGQERKQSPHQDHLLNLLRGSPAPASSSPAPVELAASQTPPVAPQILRRSQFDNDTTKQRPKGPRAEAHTSATVSGPLNMPQFEGMPRSAGKKGQQNGSIRKQHKDRQAHTQAQAPSSPITILARPQSAKKDRSSTPPRAPQGSRTSSQSRGGSRGKPAEPQKPFQPQILRRSDKPDMDSGLPLRPKADDIEQRSDANFLQPETGRASPAHTDRRPSQTAAQKEALLSLFGNKSNVKTSPKPWPSEFDAPSAKQPGSSVISPLSPSNLPSISGPISRRGTPVEHENQTQPDSKAFLLGFLEGVAKGNK